MKTITKNTIILLLTVLLALSGAACAASDKDDAGGNSTDSAEEAPETEKQAQENGEEKAEESEEEPGEEPEEEPEEEKEASMEKLLDKITINTQSSIRIEGSKLIYLDPYKRGKASHDADIVFITHSHYDHLDGPSLGNVVKKDTVIVCPESVAREISAKDIITMKAGQKKEIGDISVEAVPAYNLNKNYHPKANGWLGYIITMDGVRYYAAGDTDALPELEDIDCDIAFVPVGGTYTMTAAEAAELVNRIGPKVAVPIHYGTIVGRAADAETFRSKLADGIKAVIKVEDAK